MDFQQKIKKQSTRLSLTPKEMAFATLTLNGWTAVDAAVVLDIPPKNASMTLVRARIKDITDKTGYNILVNELKEGGYANFSANNETEDTKTETTKDNKESEKVKYKGKLRDKEDVLDAMVKVANDLEGLEKIKALKEIAELQQMKKEQNNEKEKLVHFFLPLSCSYCSLYKQAQENKSNK